MQPTTTLLPLIGSLALTLAAENCTCPNLSQVTASVTDGEETFYSLTCSDLGGEFADQSSAAGVYLDLLLRWPNSTCDQDAQGCSASCYFIEYYLYEAEFLGAAALNIATSGNCATLGGTFKNQSFVH